jgi:hypothetical protein
VKGSDADEVEQDRAMDWSKHERRSQGVATSHE